MKLHDIINGKKAVPFIPRPEKKEEPVHEELVQNVDKRKSIHMVKTDNPILVPRYNVLYDSFSSKQAWNMTADGYVNGSLTTVANSTVSAAVALSSDPKWRLEQWPGGVQLYPVLRWFSVCCITATLVTEGGIRATFTDTAGNVIPLGCFRSLENVNIIHTTILPTSITDPGRQTLGTIDFFLSSGATVADYMWQLGFSAAYLLPAMKGYDIERLEREEQEI